MAYWPDTGTGVDTQPARKPVQSPIRKYFTEGGIGQAPTVPGGDWFNQMTNEVLNVLDAAGIEPSKTDDDQLLQAIQITSQSTSSREALRRTYAVAGYNLRPVPESFENGGTLASAIDVLLDQSTGKAYSGAGPFPQTVLAKTNPTTGGFVDRSYVATNRVVKASTLGIKASNTAAVNASLLNAALASRANVYLDAHGCSFGDIVIPDAVSMFSDEQQTIYVNSITQGLSTVDAAGSAVIMPKTTVNFSSSVGKTNAWSMGKWCQIDILSAIGNGTLTFGTDATINCFHNDGGDFPEITVRLSIVGFVDVLNLIPYGTGTGRTINRGKIYFKWIGSCKCVINKTNDLPMAFFDTDFYAEGCDTGVRGSGTMTGNHTWHFDNVNTYIDNSVATTAPLRLGNVYIPAMTYAQVEPRIVNRYIFATFFKFRDSQVTTRGYNNDFKPSIMPFTQTHMIMGVEDGQMVRFNRGSANTIYGMKSVNDVVEGFTFTFGSDSFGAFVVERLNATKLFSVDVSGKVTARSGAAFGTQSGIDNDVSIIANGSFVLESYAEGFVQKASNGTYYQLKAPVGGGPATWEVRA